MQTLIVGAGTMGRWFAGLADGWLSVTFTDQNPAAATAAATAHEVAQIDPDAVDTVDVVCTAVPLSVTPAVIERYAPLADRAVVDLSGTMRQPVETMRTHAPECERLSLHPLFAPENAPGNVAIVAENEGEVGNGLRTRLRAAGNTPFETTVAEHDRAMQTVQAKAHVAVIAYALAAEPVAEGFETPVTRRLGELSASVLTGNPRVYAEIQEHFPGAAAVARAATRLAEADEDEFVDLYRQAADRAPPASSRDE